MDQFVMQIKDVLVMLIFFNLKLAFFCLGNSIGIAFIVIIIFFLLNNQFILMYCQKY